MKRFLIINLHSTRNAGDHALLLMSLEKIYAVAPDAQITLSANDSDGFGESHMSEKCVSSFFGWVSGEQRPRGLQRLGALTHLYAGSLWAALLYRLLGKRSYTTVPTGYRSLLQAFFEADAVLSCPGNFIYSRNHLAGIPILVPLFAMAYAWLLDKPFYLLPQTLGPIRRGWEKAVLRLVLRRATGIAVRDVTSVALMEQLGFGPDEFVLIPDLAFQFPGAGKAAGTRMLAEFGVDTDRRRPRLGVTLINWGAQNPAFLHQTRYEGAMTAAIRLFLEETGGEVLLFSQVCGPTPADDDRTPARRVAAALASTPLAGRVHLIDATLPAAILKAAYSQMDFFLGTRLHSNIFALAEGVPVIAIAYQDKTRGVLQMLGLGKWVIDIEEATAETLQVLLRRGWEQRSEVRGQVEKAVYSLQVDIDTRLNRFLTGLCRGTTGR